MGFYSGSDHNYFVFGQANPNDSDEEEVMRIVKYSKDFPRIGAVSVYGANTNIPFEAGSLRMTETAGKLYCHTCHEMYTAVSYTHLDVYKRQVWYREWDIWLMRYYQQ